MFDRPTRIAYADDEPVSRATINCRRRLLFLGLGDDFRLRGIAGGFGFLALGFLLVDQRDVTDVLLELSTGVTFAGIERSPMVTTSPMSVMS